MPNNSSQLPSQPLSGYTTLWQIVDSSSHELARGELQLAQDGGAVTGAGRALAQIGKKPFRLVVTLHRPNGSVAMMRELSAP